MLTVLTQFVLRINSRYKNSTSVVDLGKDNDMVTHLLDIL